MVVRGKKMPAALKIIQADLALRILHLMLSAFVEPHHGLLFTFTLVHAGADRKSVCTLAR